MDSQITLIGPSFSKEPALVLLLSPDNTKNTTVKDRDSKLPIYVVKSNAALTQTTIRYADDEKPLAVLERKEFISDVLTFRGKPPRKTKIWLKDSGTFFTKFPINFEEGGRTYTWNASIVGQLSLVAADSPNNPIAWFEPSKRRVVDGVPTIYTAFLALEAEAIAIQDVVIVTFLILEQKSRMNIKADDLVAGRACAFVI